MLFSSIPAVSEVFSNMLCITLEPWYNEPLYNELSPRESERFFYHSNSKIYEKERRSTNPRYSEQILPVP